jgi:hypothetical protein
MDPSRPTQDAIEFGTRKGQKKNLGTEVETRKGEWFLSAAVLRVEPTNNKAFVFSIGVLDDKGNMVPIAKTQPQRRIGAEQDELIRVRVTGITRRGNSYTLVEPVPVKAPNVPAAPSSMKDIRKAFDKMEAA